MDNSKKTKEEDKKIKDEDAEIPSIIIEGDTIDDKLEDLEKKLPDEFKLRNNFITRFLTKLDKELFKKTESFILKLVRKNHF